MSPSCFRSRFLLSTPPLLLLLLLLSPILAIPTTQRHQQQRDVNLAPATRVTFPNDVEGEYTLELNSDKSDPQYDCPQTITHTTWAYTEKDKNSIFMEHHTIVHDGVRCEGRTGGKRLTLYQSDFYTQPDFTPTSASEPSVPDDLVTYMNSSGLNVLILNKLNEQLVEATGLPENYFFGYEQNLRECDGKSVFQDGTTVFVVRPYKDFTIFKLDALKLIEGKRYLIMVPKYKSLVCVYSNYLRPDLVPTPSPSAVVPAPSPSPEETETDGEPMVSNMPVETPIVTSAPETPTAGSDAPAPTVAETPTAAPDGSGPTAPSSSPEEPMDGGDGAMPGDSGSGSGSDNDEDDGTVDATSMPMTPMATPSTETHSDPTDPNDTGGEHNHDDHDDGNHTTTEPSAEPTTDAAAGASDEDDAVCFPAFATVQLRDGAVKRMDEVRSGDVVISGAGGRVSKVFGFSHFDASVTATFVTLTMASGHSLTATRGHFVYANGAVVRADHVRRGDVMVVGGEGDMSVVSEIRTERMQGVYSPQTESGDIVVDGVLATTFTKDVDPTFAHAAMAPLRGLGAVCDLDALRWVLDHGVRRLIGMVPKA